MTCIILIEYCCNVYIVYVVYMFMLCYLIILIPPLICSDVLLGTHGYEEDDGFMSWELEPNAEFESEKAEGRVSVQGRLRARSQFWLDNLDPSSCQGYCNSGISYPLYLFT